MKKAASPRVRRSAEEAREAILDAAGPRLAEVGPAGIRLQDVARDVGVSHPTVLHHFGSREALVEAVVERSIRRLERDLVREIAKIPVSAGSLASLLETVAHVLGPEGHARVVAWLALEGRHQPGPTAFDAVSRAAHVLRTERWAERGEVAPPFEDTYFAVLLGGLALFGDAVAGGLLRGEDDPAALDVSRRRFRTWLAGLLSERLEHGARGA